MSSISSGATPGADPGETLAAILNISPVTGENDIQVTANRAIKFLDRIDIHNASGSLIKSLVGNEVQIGAASSAPVIGSSRGMRVGFGRQFGFSSGVSAADLPDGGFERAGPALIRATDGSTGDGSLLLGNGTVAIPGLAFVGAGAKNTGIIGLIADTSMGFVANGVERARLTSAGLDLGTNKLEFGSAIGTSEVFLQRTIANQLDLRTGVMTSRFTQFGLLTIDSENASRYGPLGVLMNGSANIGWYQTNFGGTLDLGLERFSAGRAKITDGSSGDGSLLLGNGAVAAPGLAFVGAGANNSGIIGSIADTSLGFVIGGIQHWQMTGDRFQNPGTSIRLDSSEGAMNLRELRFAQAAGSQDNIRFSRALDELLRLDNNSTGGAGLELVEHADFAAPSANEARFYVRDNGSGKTQLVIRFNTGAIQVIATEP